MDNILSNLNTRLTQLEGEISELQSSKHSPRHELTITVLQSQISEIGEFLKDLHTNAPNSASNQNLGSLSSRCAVCTSKLGLLQKINPLGIEYLFTCNEIKLCNRLYERDVILINDWDPDKEKKIEKLQNNRDEKIKVSIENQKQIRDQLEPLQKELAKLK